MPHNKEQRAALDRARYLRQREQWLERTRARHARRRSQLREHINRHLAFHPCVDCGESDPVVLDFDHLGNKSFNIADAQPKLVTLDRLRAEIAKCEVRCANCHRRKTHREKGHRCKLPGSVHEGAGPQDIAQGEQQ